MKNHTVLKFGFAFSVCIVAAPPETHAEIGRLIPGDVGWRRSPPLQILLTDRYDGHTVEFILDPNVVEDLGLSAEVAQKLEQLHKQILIEASEERQKPRTDDPNKPPHDRHVRQEFWNDEIWHTVRKRHTKELNELLTPQQQERLHQLNIQKQPRFTDALSDSGVAKAVGLTDAQRAQIYQLHWEVLKAEMDQIKDEARGGGDNGEKTNTLYRACPEKIMKLLSDEQRQAFEKLRGTPLAAKRPSKSP
jgi:hypothetical protein